MAIRGVLDAHPNAHPNGQAKEKLKDSEKLVQNSICTFRKRSYGNIVISPRRRQTPLFRNLLRDFIHRVGNTSNTWK